MTDPHTHDPQHERELENYLAGRHALSVRYLDASRETAPPELDAAILAAARNAVAGMPRRRARSRWRVPLAVAATMVLGVSLVSQLHDDAMPEAVRAEADAPQMHEAPAAVAAAASAPVETLSAQSVADMVAPAAPLPAPPPALRSEEQAKSAAAPVLKVGPEAQRRQEQAAGAAMEKREAIVQRERSAPADRRQAAPQARAFALAPDPAPATSLDEVSIAARELLLRLRSQDVDALTARASAALQPQLAAAMPAFAGAHAAQVLPRSGAEAWRIAVIDERGGTLGHATFVFTTQGWQLTALDPAAQAQP